MIQAPFKINAHLNLTLLVETTPPIIRQNTVLSKIAYLTQQKYTHTERGNKTVIYTAERSSGTGWGTYTEVWN